MVGRVTRKPMPEMQFGALTRLAKIESGTPSYYAAHAYFIGCMGDKAASEAYGLPQAVARYAVKKIREQMRWIEESWLEANWDDIRRARGENVPVPVTASVWNI